MHLPTEYELGESIAKQESIASSLTGCGVDGPTVSTARFVETCFIPSHVALKTQAGRTHYHAILKHVLRPETVDPCSFLTAGSARAN